MNSAPLGSLEESASGRSAVRRLWPPLWVIVTSIAFVSFVIGGSASVAIGVYINPWIAEFGWSNEGTSAVATAFVLAAMLAAPGVGVAIDKLGARPVMSVGVLMTAVGFLWAGRSHTHLDMLCAFVVVGIGYTSSFSVPGTVLITHWMNATKSVGTGIVLGSSCVGAALFSTLIGRWIEIYGWRDSTAILASLAGAMLPLTLIVRTRPLDVVSSAEPTLAPLRTPRSLRVSLGTPTFVIATASSVLFMLGMGAIFYHVVPLLAKAGFSTRIADMVYGATYVLAAIGSVSLGFIAERVGARKILALALLSCACGTLLLLGANQTRIGTVYVTAFTLLWGLSGNCVGQFVPVIFAESFGHQNLGTLIGVQSAAMGFAGAVAPVITGHLYDEFLDYRVAIYVSASGIVASLAFVLLLNLIERTELRTAVTDRGETQ